MTSPNQFHLLPDELVAEIADSGFYPTAVLQALKGTLRGATAHTHLVHNEATFAGGGVHRHLTVLVLLDEAMIICHADEHDHGRALITTEVVRLSAVQSVVLTRTVSEPASVHPDVAEAWLTVIWGSARRIDIGPAACEDPTCDADHGYQGLSTSEDYVLRMSREADGQEQTDRLVAFANALQGAIA